jgi:FkbM family methyltransferase
MKIGNRDATQIVTAIFDGRHYKAFFNSFKVYDNPPKYIADYLLGTGDYPKKISLNTNTGIINPTLYSHHDLLTVNEIFCRKDYACDATQKVILDIGANIGLSAIYFLTRNEKNRCYLYEPNPTNVKRLLANLVEYKNRYTLKQEAVSDQTGVLDFGVEETGRYGSLGADTGHTIKVKCSNINDVLEEVLSKEPQIDILKFDTEGYEIISINAIHPDYYDKIKLIYFEEGIPENLKDLSEQVLAYYNLAPYGSTYSLTRK